MTRNKLADKVARREMSLDEPKWMYISSYDVQDHAGLPQYVYLVTRFILGSRDDTKTLAIEEQDAIAFDVARFASERVSQALSQEEPG